jgi:hypothetical protein
LKEFMKEFLRRTHHVSLFDDVHRQIGKLCLASNSSLLS